MYAVEQTFGSEHKAQYILTVKANGGSVVLAIEHSPGVFVPMVTITTDSATHVDLSRAKFRVTPAGGAEYNLI